VSQLKKFAVFLYVFFGTIVVGMLFLIAMVYLKLWNISAESLDIYIYGLCFFALFAGLFEASRRR